MSRIGLKILLGCLASLCPAQNAGRGVLARIRDKAVEAILQTDNYICTEDLERVYYVADTTEEACRQPPGPPDTPLRMRDRLRLDVAVSKGAEIYSWHGEQRFSSESVGEVVKEGPIASGGFNGYLRNIFGESNILFTYSGQANGLLHFDYQVPLAASHYRMQAGKGLIAVPFHGSLTAREDDYELVSLSVVADGDQIPKHVHLCSAQSKLIYQRIEIADRVALAPSQFEMMAGDRSRTFTISRGRYSACHEYRGESKVHFDLDDMGGVSADIPANAPQQLKAGLLMKATLRTRIDETDAYAGQPVEAVLMKNVKLAKSRLLAQGAILHGYITSFEILEIPQHAVSLKIVFTSITDGTSVYLCNAIPKNPLPLSVRDNSVENGAFYFETAHLRLENGFTSLFMTVDEVR